MTTTARKFKATSAPATGRAAAAPQGDDAVAAVRVLRQFRRVFNTIKTHFRQIEKKVGVGGAQVWALSIVRTNPGIGVNGLARALDVRQPTASNLLRALLEQDFVEARQDPRDRRAVQLHLRPAGAKLLRRAPGPASGVLPDALAALDAATLARLEKDLAALIDVLGADVRGAGIPLGQP